MKKIILTCLAALMSFGAVNAQTFEFLYNGESLKDNATVEFAAHENIFGEMICETTNVLSLKKLTDGEQTFNVNWQITEDTFKRSTTQICLGGNCYGVQGDSFSYSFTTKKETEPSLLDAIATTYGTMKSVLTVSKGNEKHVVNVLFTNYDPAGISNVEKSASEIDVYTMDGRLVKKSVDRNNLTGLKGVYIIKDNNSSRKIVLN